MFPAKGLLIMIHSLKFFFLFILCRCLRESGTWYFLFMWNSILQLRLNLFKGRITTSRLKIIEIFQVVLVNNFKVLQNYTMYNDLHFKWITMTIIFFFCRKNSKWDYETTCFLGNLEGCLISSNAFTMLHCNIKTCFSMMDYAFIHMNLFYKTFFSKKKIQLPCKVCLIYSKLVI